MQSPGARRFRVGLSCVLCGAVAVTAAMPAEAQLARDALVQPVGAARSGEALIGVGVSHTANADFPLAGLAGDLTAFPELHAAWAIGPRVVLEVKGAARKALSIETRDSIPAVDLDRSLDDGMSRDVGDFELAVSFAPIGGSTGFSAGGHLGVRLPNSDETRGMGLNTTDVTIAGLFSWNSARWHATGWFGVSILEAPIEPFEQNDAFAWAVETLWYASPNWRLSAGTRGRASTRRVSPLGTGDLGELRASVTWRHGPLAIDAGIGHGTTVMGGDWSVRAGVAWTLAGNR